MLFLLRRCTELDTVMNIDKKGIIPRLIISGKICSYRYEYPRDLVCVFKVEVNGIIHLGVFAGGSLKIYLCLCYLHNCIF